MSKGKNNIVSEWLIDNANNRISDIIDNSMSDGINDRMSNRLIDRLLNSVTEEKSDRMSNRLINGSLEGIDDGSKDGTLLDGSDRIYEWIIVGTSEYAHESWFKWNLEGFIEGICGVCKE